VRPIGLIYRREVYQPPAIKRLIEVLRGEEPFKTAAVEAAKKWKYKPAMVKGQPISVYRIIQIPFRLTA